MYWCLIGSQSSYFSSSSYLSFSSLPFHKPHQPSVQYYPAYSETRIVVGGLAHVPVLIFIANFIKGKFVIKTEKAKETLVHEEPVKIIEVKDTVFKEEKAETIKELSNELDSIEKKADEVYEKVKKKKDKKKKKKK